MCTGAPSLRLALLAALSFVGLFCSPLVAAEVAPLTQRFSPDAQSTADAPNFQRHVMPLLGRLGCNGRNCHGSFQGQGGFRLSMFGYDFAADHKALLEGDEPRVNLQQPAASLILSKPTSEDDHGGGERYKKGGWEYRVLSTWVEQGAKNDSAAAGKLVRLEVTPAEMVFGKSGDTVQLKVVAHWSDGAAEDVTCLTRFSTNDEGVAQVDAQGLVTCMGNGDTYIISCYDKDVASTPVLLAVTDQIGPKYPKVPTPTKIDEHVVTKLQKLGVVPSELCTDEEFLRRASLDIAGTLPTAAEVTAFLSDDSTDKRTRKIDELLDRPEYAIWWATKFSDVCGLNAPLFLGSTTEFAKISGEQWYSWMERRIRENTPYDKIVAGIVLATSRKPGQSYEDFSLAQSQYTRKKDPIDFAAQDQNPFFWFRGNINEPQEKALAFAYTFLGVRLECAQCHKHPFDQWSQQDFNEFTAFFERVTNGIPPESQEAHDKLCGELGVDKKMTAAKRRQLYLKLAAAGERAPWREVYVAAPGEKTKGMKTKPQQKARLLGGEMVSVGDVADPRAPLMEWLRDKHNPYFASALVNRVWANYFGKGIIDPPDDQNLGNPPSNKPLLAYLTGGFVEHGYDLKWLHREIAGSRTYQLSWRPNDSNRADDRNFSHASIRRLPAEVMVDAIAQATSGGKQLARPEMLAKDRRIAVQPTADQVRTEYALAVFGKPLRTSNCDCEREQDPSLLQSIFLRNDQDLYTQLNKPTGWIKEVEPQAEHDEVIREAYLRTVNRLPDEREWERSRAHLAQSGNLRDKLSDLLWALLNTQEFITNH